MLLSGGGRSGACGRRAAGVRPACGRRARHGWRRSVALPVAVGRCDCQSLWSMWSIFYTRSVAVTLRWGLRTPCHDPTPRLRIL